MAGKFDPNQAQNLVEVRQQLSHACLLIKGISLYVA